MNSIIILGEQELKSLKIMLGLENRDIEINGKSLPHGCILKSSLWPNLTTGAIRLQELLKMYAGGVDPK